MSTAHPITTATGADVRVRFCPSPTGLPHVGLVRTALFNWAQARHTGGTFVFRIEDTDAARDSEQSFEQIIDALTWMGLDWDEGVLKGGPDEPYRQSQRGAIYQDVIARLTASGHLYESYMTAAEIEARNIAEGRAVQQGYGNWERDPEVRAAFRADDRQPALRLRVPDEDLSFDDLIRGPITFAAGSFPDFVVVRPGGQPLYTLVNPVDDALMRVTDVLRGEDLLPSTPRQIALYHALIDIGVAEWVPRFGHMPLVLGDGTKKLSKRDPESNLFLHRERGFIPEGLLNYLALLGWSIGPDRDVFSRAELAAAFDIRNVNPNPARFDLKKAEAINGDHIRLLDPDDLAARMVPYLQVRDVLPAEPTPDQLALLRELTPLVQERMQLLGQAPDLLASFFTTAADLVHAEDAVAGLPKNATEVLAAAEEALAASDDWSVDGVKAALEGALIDGLGLKPRVAFGPVRVATSGRRVSPPLFESLAILGADETLARIRKLRSAVA
ncbi:glutamate--tRNA ligase [Amnibacterium kyonggiense]|uniref:Glutamate--tRNA ligase n=1 Tax=Amnibacterium kyonggiense TaxID=595671 RepID=A0A4R7FHA2_9MICO|nr:glutamate--tRNA ligase [Amnibacterium kyonggiense]TDS76137.1 glutamyl-tRNA synthetase [Amnibacterium kyonggiense]